MQIHSMGLKLQTEQLYILDVYVTIQLTVMH